MIMEDLVDSGDDSKIRDSDSISSFSTSSSSFTESESESNDETVVVNCPGNELGLEVGLLFDQIETYLTAMVAVTPSIDPLRDDLVDTLGQPVMNLQNTLPTAPIAPTSANQWKDQPNIVEQFNFMGVPCLKVNMDSKKPIYFFKLLVTDELTNTMVLKTNKYVEQEINKHQLLKRSSCLKDWKAINTDDMGNFLGILLHMGCVKLTSFEHF